MHSLRGAAIYRLQWKLTNKPKNNLYLLFFIRKKEWYKNATVKKKKFKLPQAAIFLETTRFQRLNENWKCRPNIHDRNFLRNRSDTKTPGFRVSGEKNSADGTERRISWLELLKTWRCIFFHPHLILKQTSPQTFFPSPDKSRQHASS